MDSTKGFIYPAVLFVSALVLLIVNFTAAQYISRCMFEKETKEFYTGENLLQNGALLSIRHVLEQRKRPKGFTAVSIWAGFLLHSRYIDKRAKRNQPKSVDGIGNRKNCTDRV